MALLGAAAVVWLPVLDMPLLQDDFVFAVPNRLFGVGDPRQPWVSRLPWRLWAPRMGQAYWRPVTQNVWLAETMPHLAWPSEGRPLAAHLASLALFWLGAFLVYWLALQMWALASAPEPGREAWNAAVCGALVFVSRPLWFLGVAWPSAQQELIAFNLAIASVLAAMRRKAWLAGGLFALAMLSKESAVLAPGVLAGALLFRRSGAGLSWRALRSFAIVLALYLGARLIWIQPWLNPIPLPGLARYGVNLAAGAAMLADVNRELLRALANRQFSAPMAASAALALCAAATWVAVAWAAWRRAHARGEDRDRMRPGDRGRRLAAAGGWIGLMGLALASTAPSPYGYYLLYAGAGLYVMGGIGLQRLGPRARGAALVIFLATGLGGAICQRLAPRGNYQRAVHAQAQRRILGSVRLPAGVRRVRIEGLTRDEIWAMGWGMGLSAPVEGRSEPLALDGAQVALVPTAGLSAGEGRRERVLRVMAWLEGTEKPRVVCERPLE